MLKCHYQLNCRGKILHLGSRTHIMGVINCTPDSFYAGSRKLTVQSAVETGIQMAEDGADILDVGGESSRPGSDAVSLEEECERIAPVLKELIHAVDIPISVDTTKSEVARRALELGAHLVNDISALQFDPQLVKVIEHYRVPVILMHIKGRPKEMQINPSYHDLIAEMTHYFKTRTAYAQRHGIAKNQIVLDPGIGFGKRLDDNFHIINKLERLLQLGYPLLLGPSRKSFIQNVLDLPAEECLEGTSAAVTAGILNGAHIMRVHDVKEMKRVAQFTDYLVKTKYHGYQLHTEGT